MNQPEGTILRYCKRCQARQWVGASAIIFACGRCMFSQDVVRDNLQERVREARRQEIERRTAARAEWAWVGEAALILTLCAAGLIVAGVVIANI